jgi:asparagine synthetase B (glutamine-hydrolysing)
LPRKISYEKKLGFPLPMDDWMKDSRVKEILLDKKTLDRKIFNKNMIEKLIDSENKVKDPYDFSGKKIWMLINFELWMRTFID